jgi:hypothetical protein
MDLVADLVAIGPTSPTTASERRFATRILPRLELEVLDLESARLVSDPAARAARAAALARLQHAAALVQRFSGRPDETAADARQSDIDPTTPPLHRQQARIAGHAALAAYLAAVAEAAGTVPNTASSSPALEASTAVHALRTWADAERATLAAALDAELARKRRDRQTSAIAFGASLVLWLFALVWLWPRHPSMGGAKSIDAASHRRAGGESGTATQRLLRRLQQPEADTETPTHY